MTLRELLDDTILRLGLCDRVDLLTVRKFLDGIEAQRAILAAQGLADQLEPAAYTEPTARRYPRCEECSCDQDPADTNNPDCRLYAPSGQQADLFSPERHLTPAGGADPYLELHVEYDHDGGAG